MYVLVFLGRRELVLTRAVKLQLEVENIFVFRSFVDLFDFEALALGILNIATAIFGRKFEGQ